MIIKSIKGKTLFTTGLKTLKSALEYCAAHDIPLPFADLREAKLGNASLDGLIAPYACLWGADLNGADIGLADLRGCDLRASDLQDACFAETDLTQSDLRGAYFSRTLIEQSVLDRVRVSCPSFWRCDLKSAASMKDMIYCHLGEHEVLLKKPPLVIESLRHPLIVVENLCLWRNRIYPFGLLPRDLKVELSNFKSTINRALGDAESRNATHAIPKIERDRGQF